MYVLKELAIFDENNNFFFIFTVRNTGRGRVLKGDSMEIASLSMPQVDTHNRWCGFSFARN